MTLSIISVKILLWIIWMNVALFFPVHKHIQTFIETIITCKHLPNSKPILCYGLFTILSVWIPCEVTGHLTATPSFPFFAWKYLSKTCGLSIMGEKNTSSMPNPLLHMQIYLFLHMKRDRVNSNRNKSPLIQTATKNPVLKSFSYSHGFLQEHHLGISMAG